MIEVRRIDVAIVTKPTKAVLYDLDEDEIYSTYVIKVEKFEIFVGRSLTRYFFPIFMVHVFSCG
jgi:hypothetical protein